MRGWVVVPVLGHVLKHVSRHVLGRHVPELEHMPGHGLRHMPDKHVLEHVSRRIPKPVLNGMAHAVLMT